MSVQCAHCRPSAPRVPQLTQCVLTATRYQTLTWVPLYPTHVTTVTCGGGHTPTYALTHAPADLDRHRHTQTHAHTHAHTEARKWHITFCVSAWCACLHACVRIIVATHAHTHTYVPSMVVSSALMAMSWICVGTSHTHTHTQTYTLSSQALYVYLCHLSHAGSPRVCPHDTHTHTHTYVP